MNWFTWTCIAIAVLALVLVAREVWRPSRRGIDPSAARRAKARNQAAGIERGGPMIPPGKIGRPS